jgi:hypothetical protein
MFAVSSVLLTLLVYNSRGAAALSSFAPLPRGISGGRRTQGEPEGAVSGGAISLVQRRCRQWQES